VNHSCFRHAFAFSYLGRLALLASIPVIYPGTSLGQTERVTVTGILNTILPSPGDSTHTGEAIHLLADYPGHFYLLHLEEDLTEKGGGLLVFDRSLVEVLGVLDRGMNMIDVESIELVSEPPIPTQANPPFIRPSSHLLRPHVLGSQPWLTILCRFSDATTVTPQPATFFQNLINTTMDTYFREQSYDLINLNGSVVVGWIDLPGTRDFYVNPLNLNQLALDATAAVDAMVNFPDFMGINIMCNQDLGCCSWGGGLTLTLDGATKTYSTTWMAPWGWGNFGVMAHEMGHGFGLMHSSGSCTATYDSNWDAMSNGFNQTGYIAFDKDQLGWIPTRSYAATTAPNQEVFIERLAQPNATGYLQARISIGGSSTTFYTVESRMRVGFDVRIPAQAVVINKVELTLSDRLAQIMDADANCNHNDAGAEWIPGEAFVDASNNISVSVCEQTDSGFRIIINDNQTPTIVSCPENVTVECTTAGGTPRGDLQLQPFFGGISASDNCSVVIRNDAPKVFPLGTTTVVFTASDPAGNAVTCTANVTVVDTTPPKIEVELNRDALWPPNHKLYDIDVTLTVSDVCDSAPMAVLSSITSSESADGRGDGHHQPDILDADLGQPDLSFRLRAERSGLAAERVYIIIYQVMDHSGNVGADTTTVIVPHDQASHAIASNGFTPLGTAWEASARRFALILPSWSGQNLRFNALSTDLRSIQVGNTKGVVPAEEIYRGDLNADGVGDLVVLYPTEATRNLHLQSQGLGDPTSLHLVDDGGNHWVVDDILSLGQPLSVNLSQLERVDPGAPNSDPFGVKDARTRVRPPRDRADVSQIQLLDAKPNPLFFAPLRVTYKVQAAGRVVVEVFDRQGRLVGTLADGFEEQGEHTVAWSGRAGDGRELALGIYFLRVKTTSSQVTKKVVLLRP